MGRKKLVKRLKSTPEVTRDQTGKSSASGVGEGPATRLMLWLREDAMSPWVPSEHLTGYILGRGGFIQITEMKITFVAGGTW